MLVSPAHARRRANPDDGGSALLVALVAVLVLGIVGMTAAVLVTNTTTGLAGSRDSAQSRAAADAGLAAAVAEARRTGSACDVAPVSSSAPRYTVTVSCEDDRVTFRSVGEGPDGRRTTTEAVYGIEIDDARTGGDMVFFGSTTFTREVRTNTLDEDLLSIVIPTGDFVCQAPVPANIVLSGDFVSRGGCTVEGAVVAGGTIEMTNGPDTIKGNVTAAGAGGNILRGTVGGDLRTGGGIEFGWENRTVGGSVVAGGDVRLGSVRIAGSLTLPESATLTAQSGRVDGEIRRLPEVAPPEAPTFDAWFDYAYRDSDWQPFEGRHYTRIVLAASGSGPWTCGEFNAYPATGWTRLSTLTAPTVVDGRACPSLSTNSGTEPVVGLRTNVVLLASSFDLTRLTMHGADGAHPRVWFVVEDTDPNARPTCAGGAGSIVINGVRVSTDITAMAYTPCTVNVQEGGSWRGAFYGGSFSYGGGLSFYGDGIVLPRMPSGGLGAGEGGPAALGSLISQRDVR